MRPQHAEAHAPTSPTAQERRPAQVSAPLTSRSQRGHDSAPSPLPPGASTRQRSTSTSSYRDGTSSVGAALAAAAAWAVGARKSHAGTVAAGAPAADDGHSAKGAAATQAPASEHTAPAAMGSTMIPATRRVAGPTSISPLPVSPLEEALAVLAHIRTQPCGRAVPVIVVGGPCTDAASLDEAFTAAQQHAWAISAGPGQAPEVAVTDTSGRPIGRAAARDRTISVMSAVTAGAAAAHVAELVGVPHARAAGLQPSDLAVSLAAKGLTVHAEATKPLAGALLLRAVRKLTYSW
jgi:hypothetical protein